VSRLRPPGLLVSENYEKLCDALERAVAQPAARDVHTGGGFSIALAGGGTPRGACERLVVLPLSWDNDLPWGDERRLPQQDPASNFHMVREALLDPVDRRYMD
jgi:6-phosphogluconolactonase